MSTSGSASSRSFPSACRTVLQFLPGNIGPLGDGGGVPQHLLGVRRSGSRGKELRATRSICELPFGPTHSSPTAQVPCARRALAERLPVPSSAELSSGLGRAVGAEGCLGSVQACPQTRGAPRPRASRGAAPLLPLCLWPRKRPAAALSHPCSYRASSFCPGRPRGSVLFYVDLLSF